MSDTTRSETYGAVLTTTKRKPLAPKRPKPKRS